MPEGVPRVARIALDLRVLGAAAGLALVTGMLFGMFPRSVVQARSDQALKDGGRGERRGGRQRLRSALVVAEIAIAVVLLVGAALFIGSFVALMRIDPGFDPSNVLTVQVSPRSSRARGRGCHAALSADRRSPEAACPRSSHAAVIAGGMPLSGAMMSTTMTIPGGERTRRQYQLPQRQRRLSPCSQDSVARRAGSSRTATARARRRS